MNHLKLMLSIVILTVSVYSANVISWVPPYFIDKCLPTSTTGTLNESFGGVTMGDGLTHLALQFWNPDSSDGSLYFGSNGSRAATPSEVTRFKQWGTANNVKILLCVYNTTDAIGEWNWNVVTPIIRNSTRRGTFVANLVSEMEKYNLDGIEIDLENGAGGESDASYFNSFISELSQAVRAKGKILTVASFHYIYNMPNHNMWSTIFPLVDGVSSMGYTDIYAGGSSYHGYSYQKDAAPDAEKLMLGMPTYAGGSWGGVSVQTNVDWAKNNGVGVGVWDASLGDGNGNANSAWRTSGVWNSLKAIKDAGGTATGPDTTNPSSDLLTWATWSNSVDTYGSQITSGSTVVSAGVATGTYSLVKVNATADEYSYGYLEAKLPTATGNNLSSVNYIKVNYKSNASFNLVLPQAPLDASGESWQYTLPSTNNSYSTVLLPLSYFTQPSWVETPTSLDLSKVTALQFTLEGDEASVISGSISVKDLVLYNYQGQESGSTVTTYDVTATAGTGGTISPSGVQSVNEGDNITFTITAASGYAIEDVKVGGVSKGAVSSVTVSGVTGDVTVAATFKSTGGTVVTPAGNPVDANGNLSVSGRFLVNEHGDPIQLRGMSTHGIQYFESMYSGAQADTICKALAENWEADVIRISNYVNEGSSSTYNQNPTYWRSYVDNLVDAAARYGIYAIIDWHMLSPGNPNNSTYSGAEDFWAYMAAKHGGKEHVIFEICNEPNGTVGWAGIKSYAETIIPIIRANDPDNATNPNVVIVGTSEWASRPNDPIGSLVSDPNVMYTFHFYAAEHVAPNYEYMDNLLEAINAGIPVFVTEFGTQNAAGEGANNFTSSQHWLDTLAKYQISWVNWNLSNDWRSGAVYETSAGLYDCADYADSAKLKEAGEWILDKIKNPADSWSGSTVTYPETSNMINWATWEVGVDGYGSTIDTGASLITNGAAKATVSLVKVNTASDEYSWGSMYASLPAGDAYNLDQVKKIQVTYRSTVPARLSLPMPVDSSGEAYYVDLPASSSYTTQLISINRFLQPSWAADANLDHALNLSAVTSLVFTVDGDESAVVNGYVQVDSLTLFNYQGEESGLTTKVTELHKTGNTKTFTVKDSTVQANKDTLVVTSLYQESVDTLINQIDTLNGQTTVGTSYDTVSITFDSTFISSSSETLTYQATVRDSLYTDTITTDKGITSVVERTVKANKDTVESTIRVQHWADSIYDHTVKLTDNVITSNDSLFVKEILRSDSLDTAKVILPYQATVRDSLYTDTITTDKGITTVVERTVKANKDTVESTIRVQHWADSIYDHTVKLTDNVVTSNDSLFVKEILRSDSLDTAKVILPYQATVRDSLYTDTITTDKGITSVVERTVKTNKDTVESTIRVQHWADSIYDHTVKLTDNVVTSNDSLFVKEILRSDSLDTASVILPYQATVRDSLYTDTITTDKGITSVVEREVLANKDTVESTIRVQHWADSIYDHTVGFTDNVIVSHDSLFVKEILRSDSLDTAKVTLPYVPTEWDSLYTDTISSKAVLEARIEREILANKDTVQYSIVTQHWNDSVYDHTVTIRISDNAIVAHDSVLVNVLELSEDGDTTSVIFPYQPVVAVAIDTVEEKAVIDTTTDIDTLFDIDGNGTKVAVTTWYENYTLYTIETVDTTVDGIFTGGSRDTLSAEILSGYLKEQQDTIYQTVGVINTTGAHLFESGVYPNPATEEASISVPASIDGEVTLVVFDVVGNRVFKTTWNTASGRSVQWDLTNESGIAVAPGTYVAIITIEERNGTVSQSKTYIGVHK